MAVVPGASILGCIPNVSKIVPRSNGTLSHSVYPIHMHGQVLADTVPVNTGAIVLKSILNGDIDNLSIPLGSFI